MPAAAGAAALVPSKQVRGIVQSAPGLLLKPGTVVFTPSAPASSGFWRTSGLGSGWPSLSNSLVTGPRELKPSAWGAPGGWPGSPGWFQRTAATASEPFAEAASGLIALEKRL